MAGDIVGDDLGGHRSSALIEIDDTKRERTGAKHLRHLRDNAKPLVVSVRLEDHRNLPDDELPQ